MKLADEFVLMALRPDGRSLIRADEISTGAAAAALVDLEQAGHIRIVADQVEVVYSAPTGDPELDGILRNLIGQRHPGKTHHWIGKLSRDGLYGRLLTGLAAQGMLRDGRRGLFSRASGRGLPVRDPRPAELARARLLTALEGGTDDRRTLALLAIAHASRLDRALSPGVGRRELKQRASAYAGDHWSIRAVRKAIGSRRAAIVAANGGVHG